MNFLRSSFFAAAAALIASSASAQSNTNTQRCQNLGQEVQTSFQNSVLARVPKTDPTTFNQDGYDIKGIMSQDVTSGLSKLLSLDFSGIIDSVVNQGLERAAQRATANFSQRMNGVLNGVGIQSVPFQASASRLSVPAPPLNTIVTGASTTAKNGTKPAVSNGANKAVGPYGRP